MKVNVRRFGEHEGSGSIFTGSKISNGMVASVSNYGALLPNCSCRIGSGISGISCSGMRPSKDLGYQDLSLSEMADDLFCGITFSRHDDPFLVTHILTLGLGTIQGGRSMEARLARMERAFATRL